MLRIAYKPCSDLPSYKPDVAFGHPPSNLSHIKPWEEDLGTKKEILIFQLQLQERSILPFTLTLCWERLSSGSFLEDDLPSRSDEAAAAAAFASAASRIRRCASASRIAFFSACFRSNWICCSISSWRRELAANTGSLWPSFTLRFLRSNSPIDIEEDRYSKRLKWG